MTRLPLAADHLVGRAQDVPDTHHSVVCYRQQAILWTDAYQAYQGVIPAVPHRAITKKARKTNHIERLNCTLRQRLSRLIRSALSFSKKLENHIGAIRYFFSDYNLELARA